MGASLLGTLAAASLETLAAASGSHIAFSAPSGLLVFDVGRPVSRVTFLGSCCPLRFQSACGGTPLRGVAARPDRYPGKNVSDKRYST